MSAQRIVAVDDEESILKAVRYALEQEGFEVHTAGDAAGGAFLVEEVHPDLLILDIMLPGKSGLDLAREIRQTSDVPIVMLSARGDEVDRILGLEEIDWIKRTKDQQAKSRAEAEKRQKEGDKGRILNTTPSHPLEDYAGDYEHPAYGTISVVQGEGGLRMKTPVVEGPLVHYHYDVFDLDALLLRGEDPIGRHGSAGHPAGRPAALIQGRTLPGDPALLEGEQAHLAGQELPV